MIGQRSGRKSLFITSAAAAFWLSFLFLPFKGLQGAVVLFAVLIAAIPFLATISNILRNMHLPLKSLETYLPADKRVFFLVLAVPVALLPFTAGNYIIDVAILSGIYIILAQGLNVVVGFTGMLNLGFVAFYALGAYSYALINTQMGLGFWSALPFSLMFTTLAGFLLAIPAARLKGDYLAIVTLGFGEIVYLVLNNWDGLTKGPNGISGIEPPVIFGISMDKLSSYYFLVLFFVILCVFVMRRIRDSRIGRAWIAIREDEIAASAMGVNTTMYKLYSNAFGAFWAGLAGCLFAAKMQFVSPESFRFMESVLILCMVILGGSGSIVGVTVGALILVFLPEMLREVQMYRMLALGCGLVFLMIFRPQGLFGGKGVSAGG
jgi:branched-chain amino acid transport system permease protein